LPPQPVNLQSEKKSNTPYFIYAIGGMLAVVIIVGLMWIFYLTISPKKATEVEATKANAEKTTTTTTSTPATRSNTGSQDTTFRQKTSRMFQIPEECLHLDLEEGPDFYPKGGGIRITSPSSKSFVDMPGVDRKQAYEPPGSWTFCAEPKGSVRKIEIYNKW
jgi:hypothetical protein